MRLFETTTSKRQPWDTLYCIEEKKSLSAIYTLPGDLGNGDHHGLGAVPGKEADFLRSLGLAVKHAKALDCSRIHLMARRVPMGLDQATAAAEEMHAIFLKNLTYAANVLLKEGILGLVEPINTRITDPRYFLNVPHQGNTEDGLGWLGEYWNSHK
ncbi:putative hydroxypyruvate isomerase [Acipenser ruthenus]|uniref:Putative hydroxypyruvate isomerase n=1 Tax=Acipenser ruthenus TaxID=7906 RepID=A0A444U3J8_ACIRT|nr:putative hydroxypyruvate isomerase [Acipenser ruthenus]